MKNKVLITDDVHPSLIAGLKQLDYDCDYQPNINDKEVREIVHNYIGLIINSKISVNKDMIDRAPNLRFVGRLGSGLEIIDLAYAAEKGVHIINSPEGNRNAVAEHALAMLLAMANNLVRSNNEVKNFDWQREKNRGFELREKTIGIIGFGHTGSSFAQKLLGLGMRILVFDKYLPAGYTKHFIHRDYLIRHPASKKSGTFDGQSVATFNFEISEIEESNLETIQNECDIISFHLPLNTETKYMCNAEFIGNCKKNIYFLNTSRGNVVNTYDLITGLQTKKVRGACLDVFENEKPNTYTDQEREMYKLLFSFDNVIVSPHIAGWTSESKERLSAVLLEKITRFESKS